MAGWLSSLFNLADGLWATFGVGLEKRLNRPGLDWEADRLVLVVRGPFASKTSQAGLVCGQLDQQTPLVVTSHMPEGG